MNEKIRNNRQYELAAKIDPANPEWLAMRAVRLKELGDHAKAYETSVALLKAGEAEPDKRAWALLGSYLLALPPKGPDDPATIRTRRQELLKVWLAETERKAAVTIEDPDGPQRPALEREVRNRCRDITELYADDETDTVRDAIKRARRSRTPSRRSDRLRTTTAR